MKLQGYYRYIFSILLCNSLYVFSQNTSFSCNIWGIDNNYISRPVNTVFTTNNGTSISGKYLTVLGKNHTTVINPYIIVEGIDFLNDQYFDDHIDLFNNTAYPFISNALIYNLYNNGYDVIILDFDNSTIKIQDNAMLLVQLIHQTCSTFSINDDRLVVMGYSMGGLVARYALTWMEANNQNHHTRLFVSHDAPQKGANFPLGLQELVEDIRNNTSVAWIAVNALMMTFNSSMPAASQMLIYHYSNSQDGIARPSDEGVSFFSELYNLSPTTNGYPARPLKIATSNGNFNGTTQYYNDISKIAIQPGDKILEFNYSRDNGQSPFSFNEDGTICGCTIFELIFNSCNCPPPADWGDDEIKATVRAGFDETYPLEEFSIYSLAKYPIGNTGVKVPMGGAGKQTFFSNNYSYDIAPGSYSPTYMNVLSAGISNILGVNVTSVNRTCFIPTISALDLNVGISEPFNLNSSQCYTNFDYIYANNSLSSFANNNHFSLQPGAEQFIMSHVLANETPRQKYFYTDMNLDIPSNKVVTSNEQYNKTAKYTITNNGSFTVNSGGSSSLLSSQFITLKAGFNVSAGGLFSATISPLEFMCEENVQFTPRQLAPGLQPDSTDTSIQKIYNCSNYNEMPDYNPNVIYSESCIDSLSQDNISSVDSIMNENITVYPNPTSGIMNIVITELIPIDNLIIRVFDSMNNLIYTVNPVCERNMQFNLPNCIPGLLTVQFEFNNNIYIYNKKVIKN